MQEFTPIVDDAGMVAAIWRPTHIYMTMNMIGLTTQIERQNDYGTKRTDRARTPIMGGDV